MSFDVGLYLGFTLSLDPSNIGFKYVKVIELPFEVAFSLSSISF